MNKIFFGFTLVYLASALSPNSTNAQAFSFINKNNSLTILYNKEAPKLDSIVAHLLAQDIERVTGRLPGVITNAANIKGNVIVVGNISSRLVETFIGRKTSFYKSLVGKWECFGLKVIDKPLQNISKAFIIAGSDARGTAYGVFTLSKKMGVSPWYWWADVRAKQQKQLNITQQDFISSPPDITYRGIFINDEDWGLQPWAAKTFETEAGNIGPMTYAKVFELLLRLKANLIWPAMHPGTKAFFHYPENVKMAKEYQIIVGSSHAEPMLRNNVSEWNEKTMGQFNYLTNKEKILNYWEDRVKESSKINAIYSLGMRGVHDGQMEGVKNLKEAVPIVENIIQKQRDLLAKYINKDVASIPQVLTPYKEVLEIYDNGLKVPDDVTLVWPDDNYGYIQRLNNEKEKARKGGAGVYYHASYWGRPHDYLWLPSTHPSLMREEMLKAYETGANRLWVVNVGDIKPQEYNIQEFLDMAYHIAAFKDSRYPKKHLLEWADDNFGKENAQAIQSVLWQYYQLAFDRKPEFMGWSQTEPETKTTYTAFNHFYFGDEAQQRIDKYNAIEKAVKKLKAWIGSRSADAFYELVYYPVVGASWMNKKFLYRDKAFLYAKQNRLSAYDYAKWSQAAYDSIVKETASYNTQLAGGKWKNIMSMKPRDLAAYQRPDIPVLSIDSTNSWGIAPEGFVSKDSSLQGNTKTFSLPSFDDLNKQHYFIDLFSSKIQSVQWTAAVSNHWIHLSQKSGTLSRQQGKIQSRIWVDVDWSKLTRNKQSGTIIFKSRNRELTVQVEADPNKQAAAGYNGFIENNGYVSIYAAHYTRQTARHSRQWAVIDGLGYTGSVLQALPIAIKGNVLTNADSIKSMNSFVAYDFYTFSSANPMVTIMALPTSPINNNYSVRYALSIDDSPLKIIDIKTVGRSEEWKQNVLRNRAKRNIEMPFLKAGKHTLKIYTVDPGVMLDEIRINLGGLKNAYGSIDETKTIQ